MKSMRSAAHGCTIATLTALFVGALLIGAIAWSGLRYRDYQEFLELRLAKANADREYIEVNCKDAALMIRMAVERECDARTHAYTKHSAAELAMYDLFELLQWCGKDGCGPVASAIASSALTFWMTTLTFVLVATVAVACLMRCGGRSSFDNALPTYLIAGAEMRRKAAEHTDKPRVKKAQ